MKRVGIYLGLGIYALAVLVTAHGILARDWLGTMLGLVALTASALAIGNALTEGGKE